MICFDDHPYDLRGKRPTEFLELLEEILLELLEDKVFRGIQNVF